MILVGYIPVLHEGYYRWLLSNRNVHGLYIVSHDVIEQEMPYLRKDIRRLNPSVAQKSISALNIIPYVGIANDVVLLRLDAVDHTIAMPDEDVSHAIAKKYFKKLQVIYHNIFLRWDKKRIETPESVTYDEISSRPEDLERMSLAEKTAQRSSDQWLHVGAIIEQDDLVLAIGYNHHPTPHAPYINGDVRMLVPAGTNPEISTALHAEAHAIGSCARKGITLYRASMYITHFPCSPCAMLLATSGITKCFYRNGFSNLGAQKILKDEGVRIVFVPPPV